MKIGFVTDEISAEVEEALRLGVSWGIYDYELRAIGKQRVPNVPENVVKRLVELMQELSINFTALSPGTFKGTLHDHELLQRELQDTLPRTFDLAHKLDADKVITFGVQRSAQDKLGNEARVVEIFQQAASAAQRAGLMLVVENEPGFWCDSGVNTARILASVDSPALRANWDPANAIGDEEFPYPDGYEAIKPWIANVHVKDTIKGALIECVPVGKGGVDWRGQLQALVKDQVVEHLVIETHCLPLIENSLHNLKVVREMLETSG